MTGASEGQTMIDQLTVNLKTDPQLGEEIERMKALVPNADANHGVQAAFIIDLTEHVANAAGEGFMGTGEKVSQAEIAYINHLKGELGLS